MVLDALIKSNTWCPEALGWVGCLFVLISKGYSIFEGFSENYTPYDREIEERIQKAALGKGIRVQLFKDTVIVAPGEVSEAVPHLEIF